MSELKEVVNLLLQMALRMLELLKMMNASASDGKRLDPVNALTKRAARSYFEGRFIGYYTMNREDGESFKIRLNLHLYQKDKGEVTK